MEFWKKEKRILTGFGIFLAFMFLCTLISRAVYASLLPQVTVEKPERTALGHQVEAEGIVRQGQEYAVYARAGIRVRTVCCQVGDRLTADTVLFELDTEDLKEQIKEQELAIQKLKLQIQEQEQNKNLEDEKRQTDSARAQEDYNRAQSKAAETLNRAEDDLDDAEDELEYLRDHPVQVTPEEERQAKQKAYEDWAQQEAELGLALEQARSDWEAAQAEVKCQEAEEQQPENDALEAARLAESEAKIAYDEALGAYEACTENPVEKPDYSAEDAEQAAWEERKQSLKDTVEAAKRAVEDAEQSQSDTLLEAGRKVDDTNTQTNADNSLEINRLELSGLEDTLADYRELLETDGKIYPEAEGIITRIQVSAGERTPDGAAVVYADLLSPLQFCVSLTKEQKKYVNQGDEIQLTLGGNSPMEATADYVAENELDPSLYDVTVFLPENTGAIGESGTLEASVQSETFSCCIPMEALHEDSAKRNFVYVVSEREGILGKELTAELVYVRVLDQNEKYAAIEEGVIDQDTEVIVSSTEELSDRAVIRYKE